jgi:hypothetical protein
MDTSTEPPQDRHAARLGQTLIAGGRASEALDASPAFGKVAQLHNPGLSNKAERIETPVSAADFLLSPAVQKLMQVLYAAPDQPLSADELARRTKQEPGEVGETLEHLVKSGILARQKVAADRPETVKLDRSFVFYGELRSIALKSFAAAEPIRAMLRSKFKDSVVRAFILGEDADNVLELLIVHGAVTPDETAMTAACKKLSKALHRHLQVHVISIARFNGLADHDTLAAKLAGASAFEIIAPGDTKAQLPVERLGLLQSAKKKLAALSLPQRRGGAR